MTKIAIKMQTEESINLMGQVPALHRISVGLGWDVPGEFDGFPVDLDASAFLLGRNGKVRCDTDFIFYNNLEGDSGNIRHMGDNTTGAGDGDDERIEINLEGLAFDVEKVVFSVTIHNAQERQETFKLVKNAYIRINDLENNEELIRFDLQSQVAEFNGMIFGELMREGMTWSFKALGHGVAGGLYQIARDYGVNVAAP